MMADEESDVDDEDDDDDGDDAQHRGDGHDDSGGPHQGQLPPNPNSPKLTLPTPPPPSRLP